MRIEIPKQANHIQAGKIIAARLRELGYAYPQDVLNAALRYTMGKQTQVDEQAASAN